MKMIKMVTMASLAIALTHTAYAKTPDTYTPAVETVCPAFQNDTGPAFGLCNSYCEAIDCGDPMQHANDRACERIANYFTKTTGMRLPDDLPVYDDNGVMVEDNCVIRQAN